jgi:hypothetical protein
VRADAGTLYAATSGAQGQLYILDPATGGVLREIGPLNDAAGRNYPMSGMAFHPLTKVLYGATHYSPTADPATVSKLVTINPDTAEVNVIGSFFPGYPWTMTDLAFYPTGELSGIGSFGPPQKYDIDVNTGVATRSYVLGEFLSTEGGGVAVREGLNVFADTYVTPTADEFAVYEWVWYCAHSYCSPVSRYTSISNPDKPTGGGNYGALDFDGDVLYGLNVGPGSPPQTHLVTINRITGAVTDIGRSVDGLEAIAFVPEPATLVLWTLGFATLAHRKRIK